MARKRRYTRTLVRVPRRPFSRNLVDTYATISNTVEGTNYPVVGNGQVVCKNAGSQETPTPGILKTTRFRFQGGFASASATSPLLQYLKVGLLYMPEVEKNILGEQSTSLQWGTYLESAIKNEPERLLAYKNVPVPTSSNGMVSITMSSKLSRNLKSGDQILFFYLCGFYGTPAQSPQILGNLRGEIIFYTRYN